MASLLLVVEIFSCLTIAIIIISLIGIIYFSLEYYQTSTMNNNINVLEPYQNCTYNNLPLIKTTCTTDTSSFFYQSTDTNALKYKLSTTPKNYLDVCGAVCTSGFNQKLGTCTGKDKNEFQKCISDLQPPSGCGDMERPLGYRILKGSNKKINFYAQKIFNNSC